MNSDDFDKLDCRGRRALLTGITGQDGSYLAELLLAHCALDGFAPVALPGGSASRISTAAIRAAGKSRLRGECDVLFHGCAGARMMTGCDR